jgi:Na+-driven multidrug efflux pump
LRATRPILWCTAWAVCSAFWVLAWSCWRVVACLDAGLLARSGDYAEVTAVARRRHELAIRACRWSLWLGLVFAVVYAACAALLLTDRISVGAFEAIETALGTTLILMTVLAVWWLGWWYAVLRAHRLRGHDWPRPGWSVGAWMLPPLSFVVPWGHVRRLVGDAEQTTVLQGLILSSQVSVIVATVLQFGVLALDLAVGGFSGDRSRNDAAMVAAAGACSHIVLVWCAARIWRLTTALGGLTDGA